MIQNVCKEYTIHGYTQIYHNLFQEREQNENHDKDNIAHPLHVDLYS